MKRNKKKTIEISPKNLEDLIWMSYRYCIGRRTAAASMHAGTIAELIFNNLDIFTEERRKVIVEDIRRSILDVIKWNKHIKIEGHYAVDNWSWDFYSALLIASKECPFPSEAIYYIDIAARNVTWYRDENSINDKYAESFDSMYNDLIPWVKLANALDESCHKDITVNIEGDERIIHCFPYVAYTQGEYKQVWASLEIDAGSNITKQGYIIPEKIKKIENIS